jgi:hypothetical protein
MRQKLLEVEDSVAVVPLEQVVAVDSVVAELLEVGEEVDSAVVEELLEVEEELLEEEVVVDLEVEEEEEQVGVVDLEEEEEQVVDLEEQEEVVVLLQRRQQNARVEGSVPQLRLLKWIDFQTFARCRDPNVA